MSARGHKLIKDVIFKIKDDFYIMTVIISLPSKTMYLKIILNNFNLISKMSLDLWYSRF